MIKVIDYTENPISHMGKIAGICWGSDTSSSDKNLKRGMDCIKANHGRVFEYSDITIEIDKYSARMIRELYTSIIGVSRLQESTRYVNCSDFDYYTPNSIKNNDSALALYENLMEIIGLNYNQLETLGIPKEDIANILPLGMHTKVVLKINLRALINLYEVRECSRVYKEYRDFMKELKEVLSKLDLDWKWLCENEFKCSCEKTGICRELKSCGRNLKFVNK